MNTTKQEKKIIEYIDTHAHEVTELLQNLVRINTVNPCCGDSEPRPGESEGQLFFQKELEKTGFKTKLSVIPDDVFSNVNMTAPKDRDYHNRKNLQGELKLDDEGYTVVINGHMDTVGIDGMTIDPFSGDLEDGKIYGRGSSDDKSGLAGALMAVKAVQSVSSPLKGKIIFQSAADEECSGSGGGTLALCKEGLDADMAIVVDGLDLSIDVGSIGTLTYEISIVTEGGHASESSGVSALEKALFIKEAIDDFTRERKEIHPELNINIGIFQSGVISSMIPGSAKIGVNIDYAVQDAEEAVIETGKWGGDLVRKKFEEIILNKAKEDSYLKDHLPVLTCIKDLYPFRTNRKSLIVQELGRSFTDVVGREPVVAMGMWCDGAHLSNKAGIQTVVFGPLAKGKCHTANEYVEVADLLAFTKIMAITLHRILRRKK